MVNGMAIGTDHLVHRMRRTADVGARERLAMALQASVQHLPFGNFGKSNNRAGGRETFDVLFAGPVAALASSAVWWFLAGHDTLVVRVLKKPIDNFLVARLTSHAADEIATGCGGDCLCADLVRISRLRGESRRKERECSE